MTGKQAREMSDLAFAAWVLQEKLDRMRNPYTALASKLRMTICTLKDMETNTEREAQKNAQRSE